MKFGRGEEARSWNGETSEEQQQRSNDAPNNPCSGGHLWGFTRYETREVYGKSVRYAIYDCMRGCTATDEKRA